MPPLPPLPVVPARLMPLPPCAVAPPGEVEPPAFVAPAELPPPLAPFERSLVGEPQATIALRLAQARRDSERHRNTPIAASRAVDTSDRISRTDRNKGLRRLLFVAEISGLEVRLA